MKTRIALLLTLVMLFAAMAGLNQLVFAEAGLPNPVHTSTEAEAVEKSGTFGAMLPEGAQNARYSYIDMAEGRPIFQVDFTWQGDEYTLRARSAEAYEDISGVHAEWPVNKQIMIGNSLGRVMYEEGGTGVVLWLDALNDQMNSAVIKSGATMMKLLSIGFVNANWDAETAGESGEVPFAFYPFQEIEQGPENIQAMLQFDFAAPQGATDVQYHLSGWTTAEGAETPLGAVAYKLDGHNYFYAATFGSEPVEPWHRMGLWTDYKQVKLGAFDADLMYTADGMGVITWFDAQAGINRSVAMQEGASEDALIKAAQPFI